MLLSDAHHRDSTGFTLLEVILSLAILAGSVAVLGEVMDIASRNAADAQAEATAQLLAASVMDELLSGFMPITQQSRQPLESGSAIPWVYTVTLADTNVLGLSSVEVLVEQDVEKQFRPVKFKLVRWFAEDDLLDTTESEESETQDGGDDSDA